MPWAFLWPVLVPSALRAPAPVNLGVRPHLYMPISEDQVKNSMADYMRREGYSSVVSRMGTRQGYDVEGVNKTSGRRLVIECKGEAGTGSQHARSWGNVASAILTSLNEACSPDTNNDVGIALPDTSEYRGRLSLLKQFFEREHISIFWVSAQGDVVKW